MEDKKWRKKNEWAESSVPKLAPSHLKANYSSSKGINPCIIVKIPHEWATLNQMQS